MVELQQADASWYEVDPAFYAHGGVCFNPHEMDGIGDVEGARILDVGRGDFRVLCSDKNAHLTPALGDAHGEFDEASPDGGLAVEYIPESVEPQAKVPGQDVGRPTIRQTGGR